MNREPEPAPAPAGTPLKFGGDLYFASDFPRPRVEAQTLFLRAVRQLVPEVLGSLRQDVLPAFKAAATDDMLPTWERITAPNTPHAYAPLRAALEHWGAQFHLRDDWVLDVALLTVSLWADPDLERSPDGESDWWYPVSFEPQLLTDEEVEFTYQYPSWAEPLVHSGWYPSKSVRWNTFFSELDAAFRMHREVEASRGRSSRGAAKAFRAAAKAYRERTERLFQSRGGQLNLHGRKHGKFRMDPGEPPHPARSFEWLALYQCAGRSPESIAAAYKIGRRRRVLVKGAARMQHTGRKAVYDAVVHTAREIELNLRRSPRGRPRKSM